MEKEEPFIVQMELKMPSGLKLERTMWNFVTAQLRQLQV
jgi:hypothetical protein